MTTPTRSRTHKMKEERGPDTLVGMPPILLMFYSFSECSFKANPDYEESLEELAPKYYTVMSAVGNDEDDPLKFGVRLRIESTEDAASILPYTVTLEAIGTFRVGNHIPEEKRKTIVQCSGAAMLYTAAREFLMTLTSRGPNEPLVLPTMSFVPVPEEAQKAPAKKKRITNKQN